VTTKLELTFRGVRGSLPTPAALNGRYGGNTSCLELGLSSHLRLLLDCGSGLRAVAADLQQPAGGGGVEFHAFLSHYHLDHIMGLPLFTPLYDPGSRFTFYGCDWEGAGVRQVLEGALRPPWTPVALGESGSRKKYVSLDDGKPVVVGEVTLTHARLDHPQGVTAFRLECAGSSVVYATDCERGVLQHDERFRELCRGADVLIHDAQYTPEEYDRFRGWGHSTWVQAVEAAVAADARRLILFHHDPDRTDDEIDAIVEEAARRFPAVSAAREGECVTV